MNYNNLPNQINVSCFICGKGETLKKENHGSFYYYDLYKKNKYHFCDTCADDYCDTIGCDEY